MRRLITVVMAGFLLVMMLPMASATATPPLDVSFDTTVFFPPAPGSFFNATGSAVDDGLMCPFGTVESIHLHQAGNSGVVLNAQVHERYVCADGEFFDSGDTFVMKIQDHIDAFGSMAGNWVIKDGTGAFADIHGTGSSEGGFILHPDLGFPIGVHQIRAGKMHLD